VLVVTAIAAACATNPVTGKREFTLMSEAQEMPWAANPTRR
jgi:hypothetical protein